MVKISASLRLPARVSHTLTSVLFLWFFLPLPTGDDDDELHSGAAQVERRRRRHQQQPLCCRWVNSRASQLFSVVPCCPALLAPSLRLCLYTHHGVRPCGSFLRLLRGWLAEHSNGGCQILRGGPPRLSLPLYTAHVQPVTRLTFSCPFFHQSCSEN